jgi:hypothetical protein
MPGENTGFDSADALAQAIDVVEQTTDRLSRLVWQQLRLQFVHASPQFVYFPDALPDHKAELAKEATRGINRGRPLPHKKSPDPVQHQDALLLARLDRNEPHVRSADCLADGLGVGCIGLVALDVGLHVLRRDQAYFVTKPHKLPCPVVSTRTCFHAHQAGRQFGEEADELSTSQLAPKHGMTRRINAVDLEDRLCKIKADRDNGHSGALLGRGLTLKSARFGSRPGRSMPSSGP